MSGVVLAFDALVVAIVVGLFLYAGRSAAAASDVSPKAPQTRAAQPMT
jgi:hypothetical protein